MSAKKASNGSGSPTPETRPVIIADILGHFATRPVYVAVDVYDAANWLSLKGHELARDKWDVTRDGEFTLRARKENESQVFQVVHCPVAFKLQRANVD